MVPEICGASFMSLRLISCWLCSDCLHDADSVQFSCKEPQQKIAPSPLSGQQDTSNCMAPPYDWVESLPKIYDRPRDRDGGGGLLRALARRRRIFRNCWLSVNGTMHIYHVVGLHFKLSMFLTTFQFGIVGLAAKDSRVAETARRNPTGGSRQHGMGLQTVMIRE